jgi:5-methylcytosine-specific restriction endonuclease McrA
MKYTAEQKQTMSLEGLEKGRGLLKGTHTQTNTGKTHFKKGHTPWHIGKKGIMLNTGRTHFIKGQELSLDTRLKMSKSRRGEKNSNWRGGTTTVNQKIRQSLAYEEWRKAVFERDLYTCQDCEGIGGILHADHIKPFSLFPELRLEINNGRTLCITCHKKTKTYLNPYMKREDYE